MRRSQYYRPEANCHSGHAKEGPKKKASSGLGLSVISRGWDVTRAVVLCSTVVVTRLIDRETETVEWIAIFLRVADGIKVHCYCPLEQ